MVCGSRQTDRQTDRQTNRQTDRQTNRQTDRQTDKQTDRQTDRQTTAVLDLRVVDVLKDVFKSTVIGFEDGILGAAGGGVRVM